MTDPASAAATRLEAERVSTAERLAALQRQFGLVVSAAEGSNADDEHDPEGSTIAYERSQLSALVAQAEHQLEEVAAAASRLEDGSYGRCIVCGRDIPEARLEARPVARTCVACA